MWFSLGTSVSSTNKTDHHDITEILLKVVLNTIKFIIEFQKVRAFPGKNTWGGRNSVNNLGYYHQNFNYFWVTTT